MSATNEVIGDCAGGEAGEGVHGKVERGDDGHGSQREMTLALQIKGQPGGGEIKKIVAAEMSGAGSPEGALGEDVEVSGSCGVGASDAGTAGHPCGPGGEPEQGDEAHADEDGAPSVLGHEEPGAESADGGAGFESEADKG